MTTGNNEPNPGAKGDGTTRRLTERGIGSDTYTPPPPPPPPIKQPDPQETTSSAGDDGT